MVQPSNDRPFSSAEQGSSKTNDRESSGWIDISIPLRDVMVRWPGDPPVSTRRLKDMEHGDSVNLSKISMGAHSGTHMDAPLHFVRQAKGVDKMPLDTAIGRARVIEIEDPESIKPGELLQHRIRRGERILFKTRNSSRVWQTNEFVKDFVFISDEAALFLAERGIRVVGVDYLSVGGFEGGGSYVHTTLLGSGVWIIEGLDLSLVSPGRYELVCLPLKLDQGDGAPARAILRPGRASSVTGKSNSGLTREI